MAARIAHDAGKKVLIEHVAPVRDFTRKAIEQIDQLDDDQFATFVKKHFRLVLLTEDETSRLNKYNRSAMTENRLESAGIAMAPKA